MRRTNEASMAFTQAAPRRKGGRTEHNCGPEKFGQDDAMQPGTSDGAACVNENALAAFVDGQLARAARDRIEAHLGECDDCRRIFARAARARHSVSATRESFTREICREEAVLLPGTPIGRYVIEAFIGRGAMGVVYLANDLELGRKIAIKVLCAEAPSSEARQKMGARLLREAQAMARLSHPDVMTVYDVGVLDDQIFIAMEYVDGGTLRRWRSDRPRSCAEVLAVYERAGSGLAAAHRAGLVHRDFKPDNVLVGRDGRVRVTDFGLARSTAVACVGSEASLTDADAVKLCVPSNTLTHTGTLLGTPAYMAPEQLRGKRADARSDVFGFCVALFEALYGERPFAGATVSELQAAIEAERVPAPRARLHVPRWVRRVLVRGLRLAPEQRFESMQGLLDALQRGRAAARWQRIGTLVGASVALALLAVVGTHHASQGDTAPRATSAVARAPVHDAPSSLVPLARPSVVEPAQESALTVAPAPHGASARSAVGSTHQEPVLLAAQRRSLGLAQAPRIRTVASGARVVRPPASIQKPLAGHNGALILED
jgi:predicted Ser/Thr protein kinase